VTINLKYKNYWRKTSFEQKGVGDFFLNHNFNLKILNSRFAEITKNSTIA